MLPLFVISLLIGFPIGIVLLLKDNKTGDNDQKSIKFIAGVILAVLPIILLSILLIRAYVLSAQAM